MGAELYEIRQRMATAAAGITSGEVPTPTYTLSSGRIKLGHDRLEANSTWLKDLSSAGPYLLIRRGHLIGNDLQNGTANYEIPCDLYVPVNREADNDFTAVEKLLAALKTAWANYELSWRGSPLDLTKPTIPAHYELYVRALGC